MGHLTRQSLLLILAMVIGLTSVQFAAARGQSPAVDTMVICTGSGPVHILVDENGEPTGNIMVCPDYATAFFASVWSPIPQDMRVERWVDIWTAGVVFPAVQASVAVPQARGPPSFA